MSASPGTAGSGTAGEAPGRPSPFGPDGRVRITGHRGAAGVAPENTLPSLSRALRSGADAVEVDLQRTRDGHLVLLHDETVDRTTDGSGAVEGMSLDVLRELDAGYAFSPDGGRSHPFRGEGLRVPTLEEGLAAIGEHPVVLEVKSVAAGEALGGWLRERSAANGGDATAMDRIMVGGFSRRVVSAAAETGVRRCAMHEELRPYVLGGKIGLGRWLAPRAADAALVPERRGLVRIVTRRFVRGAHRDGLGVHVWTVNRPDRMRRLWDLGVDGIISDFPGRARRLLDEWRARP